ncbi:MAG: zinc ribbon domain-containing protein [Clostridia bacterium]|nr:zinc ribbon domain-containing protein [Clostridia bacterium]
MAAYKHPCIHCGTYINWDSRYCPSCQSGSPFGYLCPSCLRPVEKGQPVCSGCGRALYVNCPSCSVPTFVQEKCEHCNEALMISCNNPRCGVMQFFENKKCTACGKKIKNNRK